MIMFVKPTGCPNCLQAKELVKDLNVDTIDSTTDAGYFKAIS